RRPPPGPTSAGSRGGCYAAASRTARSRRRRWRGPGQAKTAREGSVVAIDTTAEGGPDTTGMGEAPTISVAIAAYNEERWIANTQVDVAFGHARMFGVVEGDFVRPPGAGVLDGTALARRLYEGNVIAAPSAAIRRALHERLGGFREDLPAEDYEFWLRALSSGAVFYYDPRLVLHYRRHGENMSMPGAVRDDRLRPLIEMNYRV